MKKYSSFFLSCVWLFCYVDSAFALQRRAPSIGNVADNLYGPMTAIISIVRAISITAGVGLVLASFAKFGDHRRNRHEVTLALVITMFVSGVCLILVGFIPFMNW